MRPSSRKRFGELMTKRRKAERRKTFSKRQRLALVHACRTADEMMHRFLKRFGNLNTILMVDIEPLEMFEGRPVWHASVSGLDRRSNPIPSGLMEPETSETRRGRD